VATVAKELSSSCNGIPDLRSYTVGYDSLIRDDERGWARKTAEHLGIPNKYMPLDRIRLFDQWDEISRMVPEPIDDPVFAGLLELFRTVGAECRVALSGEGADNLMHFQMWPYIKELRRQRLWIRLATETTTFAWVRPFPWRGAAHKLRSLTRKVSQDSGFPTWIASEFAKRMGLRQRWEERSILETPRNRHLVRPWGHGSLALPQWTSMFEVQDPGVTHCNVEVCYPFLDLRMVEYLLAIPTFPWLYRKDLIRKAMRGRMHEASLLRRKTPLPASPVTSQLQDKAPNSIRAWPLAGRTNAFVRSSMINSSCGTITRQQFRAYCLDRWLKKLE
jgi:asparagine synthase (glutamine-hydrolysing)